MIVTKKLSNYNFKGISETGVIRQTNQDFILNADTVNGYVFIVCDGMGGIAGGEMAAETAAYSVFNFLNNEWNSNPFKILEEACIFADKEIKLKAQQLNYPIVPGTTIAAGLLRDNKFYYAHAGDSRIYFATGKKLYKLTDDHSYVQNLVKKRILTEQQASNHPEKNKITNALGVYSNFKPEVCKSPIIPADDDKILICSDGLWAFVENKEINHILQMKASTKKKAETLISKALHKNSDDNISALLIEFFNTGNTKNNEKIEIQKKAGLKLKIAALTITVIAAAGLPILYKYTIKQNKAETKKIIIQTAAKGIMYVKPETDTETYVIEKNKISQNNLKSKYNTNEIKLIHQNNYKYNIYKIKICKNILIKPGENQKVLEKMYLPEISKLIQANNKQELLILPGENLIIPNRVKNDRRDYK